VLGLALLATLNPARIGGVLLLISRPRPMQNLFAYWVGALTVTVPALLIALMVLHFTPNLPRLAASSTVRHIQIGIGVLALSIAAVMTVRFTARRRAHLPAPGGNTSTLALDSNSPTATSRQPGRAQDTPTEGGSAIRRLLGRAHNAWENGSLWVAFLFGLGTPPAPDAILFVAAFIAASGAAIGAQVSAAIAYTFGMFAIIEITLASYLVTPAKTQAVLRVLHGWARAHRRKILVAMFAVVGVALVANGMSSV
jgi:hypothetical protein